jgi:plasmid stabilization system protein ParE
MKKTFILSPAARDDLIDIHQYIALESFKTATTVLNEIERAIKKLSQFPNIGHTRTDLTELPVSFWPVYNYLIIYKQESNPLEIVRVLSGYRNLINIL